MSRRTYWVNPDPTLRHGTPSAYQTKGCRCDTCYGWWHRDYERRKATDPNFMARRRAASYRHFERKRAEREVAR